MKTPPTINDRIAKMMKEDQLVSLVAEMGHATGWLLAHFRPVRIQRKDGSTYYETPVAIDGKGFPDLCMVNARQHRVAFIETKSLRHNQKDGGVSVEQVDWMAALEATGVVECGVWRPQDWLNGDIESILKGSKRISR